MGTGTARLGQRLLEQPHVNTLDVIRHELDAADATGYKHVVRVRVTTDAPQGSPVGVPFTPERARAHGALLAVPGGLVVADPGWHEHALEILVHPADMVSAFTDPRGRDGTVTPHHVFGIPVV